ncbi:MAG: hypothetical protein AAGG02_11235 [Cyanobacteria bacterium P01_H01_bin.15]
MNIERPQAAPITNEEQAQLAKLRDYLELAIADGRLTRDEIANIRHLVWEDGKVSVDELALIREFIDEQIAAQKLVFDWT